MNLDQFIKYYLNSENLSYINNYSKFECPICNNQICNFDICINKNFNHKLELNHIITNPAYSIYNLPNIYLFCREINILFYKNSLEFKKDDKKILEFDYDSLENFELDTIKNFINKVKNNLIFL